MKRTVALVLPLLLLSGCDLLLGPQQAPGVGEIGGGWTASVVTEGEAGGVDLIATAAGGLAASYVLDGDGLRLSRFDGSAWEPVVGPALTGEGASGLTRVASGPTGETAVLFVSSDHVQVARVTTSFETPTILATVSAAMRDTLYPRPTGFTAPSCALAFGDDGILRVAAGSNASPPRLWLFRNDGADWDLGVIPESQNLNGRTRLIVSSGAVEHLVFQANAQGLYYWWRQGNGWQSRVPIPGSQPYLLELRDDETSVLGTRIGNEVEVAVENYNPVLNQYRWEPRVAVQNEYLFWSNMDLVLDDDGLPGVIYIVGPLPNDVYQVWFSRMGTDGTFKRSLIAGSLRLPVFNPLNVVAARDAAGRVHVVMPAGFAAGGGWEYRLMHFVNETTELR